MHSFGQPAQRFVQDRFAIGFWVDPPIDDRAYAAWPTVEFDTDLAQVMEVSPETGKIAPVLDDSPEMEGLQLSLDAGAGRLFLLPAQ